MFRRITGGVLDGSILIGGVFPEDHYTVVVEGGSGGCISGVEFSGWDCQLVQIPLPLLINHPRIEIRTAVKRELTEGIA